MAAPNSVDVLIRAGTIYPLGGDESSKKAIAIQNGLIYALSPELHGLDGLIGPSSQVIHVPDATVLPSFDDTHTHLIFAGQGAFDVPVSTAKDIPELLGMIRERVSKTPPGQWVSTSSNWQEFNLKERRFPTLQELDAISTEHPIVVQRGGHNLVVNSCAMKLADVTSSTAPPTGGLIGKSENGELNGLLQDSATIFIHKVKPSASDQTRVDGLDKASASYASYGIGCVRDCMVPVDDLRFLETALKENRLHVRVRALISAVGMTTKSQVEELLEQTEKWRHLQNGQYLSIWGVKFMIDGGIEAGATEEPYANEQCGCGPEAFRGRLLWEHQELVSAMEIVIQRGWRVGTHAYGDRAVEKLLDVYEELLKRHPNMPRDTLVMEHGGLATAEQRKRAVALGLFVTIQQPLLHDVAGVQEVYWGRDRVSRLFPARSWLDAGADISAGSDYPVGGYGAMRSVWGLVTRQTVAGVRGQDESVTVPEAISLHTTAAAKLLRETQQRGSLAVGKWADLTVWQNDPFHCANLSTLQDAKTLYTILGGQIKWRPS